MTQSILIIGATGNIGHPISQALANHRNSFSKIGALTSEKSLNEKKEKFDELRQQGFEIVLGDIEDKKSLVTAFQGWDVVVSALNVMLVDKQYTIIDAAVEAGVKRFYPSEFASDSRDIVGYELIAFKKKVQDYLDESVKKNANFSYTLFFTGYFEEWITNPFFRFDPKNHSFHGTGDINVQFSVTSLQDVGEFLVASLLHPELGKNGAVFVESDRVSWAKIISEFEKQQKVKYTITNETIEEAKKKEAEFLQQNQFYPAIASTIYRIYADGKGVAPHVDNEKLLPGYKTLKLVDFVAKFVSSQ